MSYHALDGGSAIDRIWFRDVVGVWHQGTTEGECKDTNMWHDRFAEERERINAYKDYWVQGDFAVVTKKFSYHKGRIFLFRVEKEEDKMVWVSSIQRLQLNVKELANANQGDLYYIQQLRRKVRRIYVQDTVQIVVAGLISFNFLINIFESQLQPGPGTQLEEIFTMLDWVFSFTFFFELMVNMFATMTTEFISDGWNWFDAVVVLVSLVSLFSNGLPGVNVLRLLRAFRVFRLFKRIPSLRQIIVALNQSLPPMLNAFILVCLITAIYSIMGVTFFAGALIDITGEPIDAFSDFFTAMFTMFGVLTGDQWGDVARHLFEKDGMIPAAVAMYFVSFQLLVPLVLVNVVIAVLLDEFGKAASSTKRDEVKGAGSYSMHKAVRCPLMQVSELLIEEPTREDLNRAIDELWSNVCGNATWREENKDLATQDHGLDWQALAEGWTGVGFIPPLVFNRPVWTDLVEKQGLCNAEGIISISGFRIMLKQALRRCACPPPPPCPPSVPGSVPVVPFWATNSRCCTDRRAALSRLGRYAVREVSVCQEFGSQAWTPDMIKAVTMGLKVLHFDREDIALMSGRAERDAADACVEGTSKEVNAEGPVAEEVMALLEHVRACNLRVEGIARQSGMALPGPRYPIGQAPAAGQGTAATTGLTARSNSHFASSPRQETAFWSPATWGGAHAENLAGGLAAFLPMQTDLFSVKADKNKTSHVVGGVGAWMSNWGGNLNIPGVSYREPHDPPASARGGGGGQLTSSQHAEQARKKVMGDRMMPSLPVPLYVLLAL